MHQELDAAMQGVEAVTVPVRGVRCIVSQRNQSDVYVTSYCPREGSEMHLCWTASGTLPCGYCPREGSEMHLVLGVIAGGIIYRYCPREGSEMHPVWVLRQSPLSKSYCPREGE